MSNSSGANDRTSLYLQTETLIVNLSTINNRTAMKTETDYYYYFPGAAVAVDSSTALSGYGYLLRGVDSVRLQILLMGTCRQCGSWSVAGHNHRKVIGRDPICAS